MVASFHCNCTSSFRISGAAFAYFLFLRGCSLCSDLVSTIALHELPISRRIDLIIWYSLTVNAVGETKFSYRLTIYADRC